MTYSLLLIFHYVYYIIIYHYIAARGYGKYYVDGLNTIDKNYISAVMVKCKFTGTTGFYDQVVVYTSTQRGYIIIERVFQKQLPDSSHNNGILDKFNYIIWDSKWKCTERKYYIQNK